MDSLHGNDQLPSLLQQGPISLLPSELLREIFSLLAIQGTFQLRHALFVCRHWHNVISSDKKLWSIITIDVEILDRFKLHSRSAETKRVGAYIHACLDRSAPLPLDITISAPLGDTGGGHCCSVLDQLFDYGEPPHIQRCKSLSWDIQYSYGDIPVLSIMLPPSFEWLEYLFLNDFTFKCDPLIRFPQCPRLKEVHLVNYHNETSPNYLLDRDHPHVEKLTYTCCIGWIDYDIDYIQKFHGIRTLVLEDAPPDFALAYISFDEFEDTSIAHLHCLETLKLIGSIPLDIMQRLHAPMLRRVHIVTDNSALRSHVLDTVPLVLLQSVTEMGLSICPSEISICLSDSEPPLDPQQLRRVICGAPSLTSLFGTFGIGELLAGEGWFMERNIVYKCI